MNPNYPTVPFIRDAKFESESEEAYYGTATCPDGTVIQTLDPGGVAEQTVEMYYEPSPHLTDVHYRHANAQALVGVPDGEVESIVGDALASVPDESIRPYYLIGESGVPYVYTRPNSPLPPVTVQFAYRGKDTKLKDGSVSQNILDHGGNLVTDSKDCFLLGLQRASVQDHQGQMTKGLIASQIAKALFEKKMGCRPFNQVISNAKGIQPSGSAA